MIKWKYRPSGNAPVQAEGYFRKHQFYFRSRGTQATIEFFKTDEDWEKNNIVAEYTLATLDYPEASWLPKWMCYVLIYIGCIRFLFKKAK